MNWNIDGYNLYLGGKEREKPIYVDWLKQDLQVGDKIKIRICDIDEVSPYDSYEITKE